LQVPDQGWSTKADVALLSDVLQEAENATQDTLEYYGSNGYKYVSEYYAYQQLSERYLQEVV